MSRSRAASGLFFLLAAALVGSAATVLILRPWRTAAPTPAAAAAKLYGGGLSSVYSGKMREAVRRFSEIILKRPDDPKAYYFRGLALRDLRSLPEAISDFTRAVELDPTLAGARYLRALSRRELGDIKGALADIEALLAEGKAEPELREQKAGLLITLGRRVEALKELDEALKLKPKAYFPLVRRGEQRSKLKRQKEALADFDAAIALDATLASAYVSKAYALADDRRFEEAEAAARQAIERLPGRADLHIMKGFINEALYRRDRALADYTAAIGLSPRSHLPLMRRGGVYREIGIAEDEPAKFALSLSDLTRAVQLAPKNSSPLSARSNLYTWMNDYPKALEDAKEILRIEPRDSQSHESLADAYRHLNEKEKALAACDKAVDLNPFSSGAYTTRCLVLSSLKRYREALKDCDKAVDYDPHGTEPLYHRSGVRLKAGLRADAIIDARAALQKDPSDRRLQKQLAQATELVSF